MTTDTIIFVLSTIACVVAVVSQLPRHIEIHVEPKPKIYPRIIGGSGVFTPIFIDGKRVREDFEIAHVEVEPRHYTWWNMEDAIKENIHDARYE